MEQFSHLLIFLIFTFVASASFATVYQWVDADGNVHFGDKPHGMEEAKEVDVTSVNTMEGGQELAKSAAKNRERELEVQEKARKEALEAPDPCEEDLFAYRSYTEQQYDKHGKPYYYYATNEDGNSMTEDEQQRYVQELGAGLRARGCL